MNSLDKVHPVSCSTYSTHGMYPTHKYYYLSCTQQIRICQRLQIPPSHPAAPQVITYYSSTFAMLNYRAVVVILKVMSTFLNCLRETIQGSKSSRFYQGFAVVLVFGPVGSLGSGKLGQQ